MNISKDQQAELMRATLQFLLRVDLKGNEARMMTLCQEYQQAQLQMLEKAEAKAEKTEKAEKAVSRKKPGRKAAQAANGATASV